MIIIIQDKDDAYYLEEMSLILSMIKNKIEFMIKYSR